MKIQMHLFCLIGALATGITDGRISSSSSSSSRAVELTPNRRELEPAIEYCTAIDRIDGDGKQRGVVDWQGIDQCHKCEGGQPWWPCDSNLCIGSCTPEAVCDERIRFELEKLKVEKDIEIASLMATEAPTDAPTDAPTETPTETPTEAPTDAAAASDAAEKDAEMDAIIAENDQLKASIESLKEINNYLLASLTSNEIDYFLSTSVGMSVEVCRYGCGFDFDIFADSPNYNLCLVKCDDWYSPTDSTDLSRIVTECRDECEFSEGSGSPTYYTCVDKCDELYTILSEKLYTPIDSPTTTSPNKMATPFQCEVDSYINEDLSKIIENNPCGLVRALLAERDNLKDRIFFLEPFIAAGADGFGSVSVAGRERSQCNVTEYINYPNYCIYIDCLSGNCCANV